ncbi:MAG: CAP domain-containing protein, partial [Pseudomonadota bacterium]
FAFEEQMELAFIRLINQERVAIGLQPLILRQDMRPAARFHSLDMGVNGFFGHATPRGRTAGFRISAFDRTMLAQSTAENVAKLEMNWTCTDDAGRVISCADIMDELNDPFTDAVQRLHRDLMNSPGHRDNILSPNSTHIALGVAKSARGVYVTQLFAAPVGAFETPLPVRLVAGRDIQVDVELDGLDFKRFALMEGAKVEDLMKPRVPEDVSGDFELAVRGEDISVSYEGGRTYRSLSFMYLPGPAVTIVPPKAATGS